MSENANMSTIADASKKLKNRETMTPGRGNIACMPWRERIAELANPKAARIDSPTAAIGLASPAFGFL